MAIPRPGWYWRGDTMPDLASMQAQHDGLVEALREEQVEIVFLDECARGKMKSVYTRDSVIAVNGGAIVTRLGPPVRRGEELPVTRTLAKLGMPILRTIHGTGILEGGSFAFINPKTAVVGISSRVNEEGARQLEEVLKVQGIELIRVHLTGYRLHIDGNFVMIDVDTAHHQSDAAALHLPRAAEGAEDPHHRGLSRRPGLDDQLPGRAAGPHPDRRPGEPTAPSTS